jgi:hypothetical protein
MRRNALESSDDGIICPVRLLLANAMRYGNVEGKTIEDVLHRAKKAQYKRIVWKDENLPIFHHFSETNSWPDKPMRVKTMTTALAVVSNIVRPNVRLRAHDIRYGAADDLLSLKRSDMRSLQEVGQDLNHSTSSTAKGVTRRYTKKYSNEDTWQERAKLPDTANQFSNVVFECDGVEMAMATSPLE